MQQNQHSNLCEGLGRLSQTSPFLVATSPRAITKSQVIVFCTLSAWVQIAHLLPKPQLVILTLPRKLQ